jgi:hypothetical protein
MATALTPATVPVDDTGQLSPDELAEYAELLGSIMSGMTPALQAHPNASALHEDVRQAASQGDDHARDACAWLDSLLDGQEGVVPMP